MCGIAGLLIDPQHALDDLPVRLLAMRDAMTHRGPDDAGTFIASDGRIGLANRRLAIRDLSPAGHMPMSNAAGTLWITYNGEIYNTDEIRSELERSGYVFRSTSDTEVILHGYEAWGKSVVHHLRGMFAFAVARLGPDGCLDHLFIARDRLGIKPVYYAQVKGAWLFASEIKALRASGLLGNAISPAGLVGYLMMGSVPNPWTIYQDVQALPPASTLTWQGGQVEIERYWQLPTDIVEPPSYEAAVEQVRALLQESVRIRLVSDVPLGAFLSGGLDSSAVVALMRQSTSGPIRTCSMVFEEDDYSEAPYAQAMAQAAGAEHYERVITAQDVLGEMDHILAAMDQPTVDGVNTYFVSQTARQAGLTVALSGLGGDELFGGYPNTFGSVLQLYDLIRLGGAMPGGRRLMCAAIDRLPNRERWSKMAYAAGSPASLAGAYFARRGLFAPREVKALVHPDVWKAAGALFEPLDHIAARARRSASQPDAGDRMQWISRAELSTYTHHQLLRDTDVMSMAHSLEVRVPLLDHCLVELALRLPEWVKRRGEFPKPLLGRAVGQWLPPLVRERRDKRGFTFPFDRWFRQMDGSLASRTGLLQEDAVRQVGRLRAQGKLHWSRAWALHILAWGKWLEA